MEQALMFRAETDDEMARLKGEVEKTRYYGKRIRAHVFLSNEFDKGTKRTVAERTAQAECSPETVDSDKTTTEALVAHETLANKRETEKWYLKLYQTQEASRRQGNI